MNSNLKKIFLLLILVSIINSCKQTQEPMSKKIITSKNAPAPIGPYSHGVLIGNTLYVSGQVGKDPVTGELILSDIKKETTRVMENVKGILTDAGMDFTHVVKTTIFLTNLDNFAAVNEVYGSYFAGDYPARETVQVSRLPLNVNVEISVVAVK
jgi:2-iminobutanoate/2-iminopropanoate deaminase